MPQKKAPKETSDIKLTVIAKWSRFFIKNPKITTLIVVAIIIGGLFGAFKLTREGFPKVSIPIGVVKTAIPGATSTDVEKNVTREIEEEISTIDEVKDVESTSSNSFSVIVVEFDFNTDLDKKIQELKSAISSANLPDEAEKPKVSKVAAGGTTMLINVVGNYDQVRLKRMAEKTKDEIKDSVSNVAKVNIFGGTDEEIKIKIDLKKLNDENLTFPEIKDAIDAKNISIPGGSLKTGGNEYSIEVSHELKKIKDIEDIIVAKKSAATPNQGKQSGSSGLTPNALSQSLGMRKPRIIRLKDVAKVEKGPADDEFAQRTGYLSGGKTVSANSVTLELRKKSSTDATKISKEVKKLLKNLVKDKKVPDNLRYEIVFDDAITVKRQLNDLVQSGWQGLIVVFFALTIFISFRGSLLISTVIPLVLLSVLLFFILLGFTLNIIVLFALILTLGILVDNAIVVVESIQHHLNLGRKKYEAALAAISEVGTATFSATLTTVIVFIPMIFMGGVIGEFIKFIPYTVIISIASSFFIAVTVIPMIAGRFVKPSATLTTTKGKIIKEDEIKHWRIIDLYGSFMAKVLNKTGWMVLIITIAVVLLAFSLYIPLTGKIKSETFPPQDSEYLITKIDFPRGTSPAKENKVKKEVEKKVMSIPDFVNFSQFSAHFAGASGSNMLYVGIGDPRKRKLTGFKIADILRNKVADIKGADIRIEMQSAGPPSGEFPILMQINGNNLAKIKEAAIKAGDYLKDLKGVTIVKNGVEGETEPQIQVKLDKEKLNDKNILPVQAAATIRSIFTKDEVSKIRPDNSNESIKIDLQTLDKYKDNINDLKNIKITSLDGKKFKLKDIASVTKVDDLAEINKYDGKRYIKVQAAIKNNVKSADIEQELKDYFTPQKLATLGLKKGAISFRGEVKADTEALDKIVTMLVLALILVYIILVAQFNSFFKPFIILTSVPLALIGVFPGLLITGNVISFLANLGVVALVGIVVNDAIIFIDYANQLHNRGSSFVDSLVIAGKVRFKPILSTSITTIGGILPLAITSDFWSPIGTAVMSGLAFSTIGTLIVIPAIYTLTRNGANSVKGFFTKSA